MAFGKQIDEHEAVENTSNNQPTATQNVKDVDYEVKTPEVLETQTEDRNDVMPQSPEFSNLTTDVGDNPDIHRPPPIESPPIPPKSQPTVVGRNPRKTAKVQSAI